MPVRQRPGQRVGSSCRSAPASAEAGSNSPFGWRAGIFAHKGHHADQQQAARFRPRPAPSPMIVPVRIPGAARGNTWWKTVCIFEAPTPNAASRIDGGTAFKRGARRNDDRRQRHQCQHQTTDNRRRLRQARKVDEDRKTKDTEDNRRHSGKVRDIHLDQVGEPVLRRKFFQIDRRGHADRQRQNQHHDHHIKRPKDRHAKPCGFGAVFGGIRRGDEVPVEPGLEHARIFQCVGQLQLLGRDILVAPAQFPSSRGLCNTHRSGPQARNRRSAVCPIKSGFANTRYRICAAASLEIRVSGFFRPSIFDPIRRDRRPPRHA